MSAVVSGRSAAVRALERWRRAGTFSEDAVSGASAGLDAREAALCSRLVYGTIQNTAYLDHYIGVWCSTPVGRLEPKVLDILRISAYQLLFMDRIPPSAAVNEAVALCKSLKLSRASGLINAVLRRISENRDKLPAIPDDGTAKYLSIKYSHPIWLVNELIEQQGYDFTAEFLAANNEEPPIYAQVNTLKTDADSLTSLLADAGVLVERGNVADCLVLRCAGRVNELPGYDEGLFYIQDEAARQSVIISGVEPGMTVLDACAAPGGKSFAAGIQMYGKGRIVACDVQEKKLRRISEGATRLGLNIIETRQMDARRPEPELIDFADVVISDVPCSGLGVIRKKPEIRYKSRAELDALPQIQSDILDGLAACVKPGGTLLYSTCTVRSCENEDVISAFLARNSEFSCEKMHTLWPNVHKTDGFFICKMLRSI